MWDDETEHANSTFGIAIRTTDMACCVFAWPKFFSPEYASNNLDLMSHADVVSLYKTIPSKTDIDFQVAATRQRRPREVYRVSVSVQRDVPVPAVSTEPISVIQVKVMKKKNGFLRDEWDVLG